MPTNILLSELNKMPALKDNNPNDPNKNMHNSTPLKFSLSYIIQ